MIRSARLAASVLALMLAAGPALAQAPSASPDRREVGQLVYDGIPEVPAALRASIQRWRNSRSAGFQDWMDDGSILITTRFGETGQIHRVVAPGAARTQMTFFPEPIAGAEAVPGQPAYAYSRDAGGAEYFQI